MFIFFEIPSQASSIVVDRPPELYSFSINNGQTVFSTSEHWNISAQISGIDPSEVSYCYVNFISDFKIRPYIYDQYGKIIWYEKR